MGPMLYLDAFLELPATIAAAALAANERLSRLPHTQIRFADGRTPHVTLFMGLFPEKHLPALCAVLRRIAASTPPFSLQMESCELSGEGYLFWKVHRSAPLQQLHESVACALTPYREGAVREKFQRLGGGFSYAERQSLQRYGFPWAGPLFRPHVTLTRFSVAPPTLPHVLPAPLSEGVSGLGLGTVGSHGSLIAVSHRFAVLKNFPS